MTRDATLDDLVDSWMELHERGQAPPPEEFCAARPDLLEQFRREVQALRAMDAFLKAEPEGDEVCKSAGLPAVPGYEILGEIGRGGMGVVYRARQLSLRRTVALKMILGAAHARPEQRLRFRAEAEAAARLQHPGIVQVYDIGEHQGLPYFSLEFVRGGTLATRLKGGPLPPRQAAGMVKALAEAMHHAHQRGVVHRDLKPGNVLITEDGTPKVTDFGLAKRLEEEGHTRSGDVLGTAAYMAPEQARGRAHEAGPAADVYALGAILYECLTGVPPFRGQSYLETLDRVLRDEPVPPGRVQPGVPRDLQAVCLTCLRKDPSERYPTAGALADDLQAFLGGRPVRAPSPSGWQRFRGWARRRPWQAGAAGGAALAALGLLAGLLWHDVLGVAGAALLLLLGVAWWYNARLQAALRNLDGQHAAAERNLERMRLLLETTRRIVGVADQGELLRLLGETTALLCDAERATIFLLDRQRGELWSRMMLVDEGEIRVPLGVGVAGAAAQTGETIHVPDAYADPRFNPEVDRRTGFRTRNLFTVPMTNRAGQVLGVFQVVNKRAGAFTQEDAEMLHTLAASAALAVEHARWAGATPPAGHVPATEPFKDTDAP